MSDSPDSPDSPDSRALQTEPAAPLPPVQRYASRVIAAIFLLAMLLPTAGFSFLTPQVRDATIMTTAATGIGNAMCSIVVHYADRREDLQYLCLPMGLTAGSVAAAMALA